ncbi:tetratricopeptide repeat protein [Verrucomicrobiaceae bacterium R5-34]|uniref:Tetratricopeptide repeat protein n=1 Tax=Oceaniferula flava TaxID=2800421 RepID=A0AAE2SAX3_9BACT|nr:tetratricopeptide repeat protein [Oceaniferula flavus]MBK1831431.1 tetratricopeptide repeat protein [Verrucomicrobiaceae bacterium R5-34]MBK1854329.1 tetratricopeptide repeat protein [Oceaniferula flavus]MBM1135635.1 tetratricopeptide repeat protein [Oceaniferula flavus]
MRRLFLLILTMLPLGLLAAEQDDQRLFTEANDLFARANAEALVNPSKAQELYQASILKYQFLIEQRKLNSAELQMNLGNAYFSSGETGRAMLHYQRAQALDPLNDEVRHNLEYVRSLTIDELPETTMQRVKHALSFWHRWPVALRGSLFAVGHLSFWALVAWSLYRRGRWLYGGLAVSGLLSVLFGVSLLVSHQAWDNPVDGVVVEREVIARQGDGIIYDNAFSSPLHAGTEFEVLERRGDWYHIQLLNGDSCWLPTNSSELVR